MAVETTSTLSNNIHSYYHKLLLENARAKLRLLPLGKMKVHPSGMGTDSYVLKFGHVAEKTTPLTQGTNPTESTIDTTKYTISIKEYGQYIKLSQLLAKTAIDPVEEDTIEELGYRAAKDTDTIIFDELESAATNVQYVGSSNTDDDDIAANELVTAAEALKGVRELKGQDSPEFSDGCYVWVVHPRCSMDIQADTTAGGFIELNKYVAGLADKPLKGEVGKVYGARVVESSNVQSVQNAGSVNVYRTLMLAKDAFCVTKFDKNHVKLIRKSSDSGGVANPLEMFSTVGYKMQFGVKYIGGAFTGHEGAGADLCVQVRGAATGG